MLVPRFVMFSLKSRVFPSRRTLCTVHTAQVDPSMISMGRAIGDRERDAGGDAFPCPPPPLHARVRLPDRCRGVEGVPGLLQGRGVCAILAPADIAEPGTPRRQPAPHLSPPPTFSHSLFSTRKGLLTSC